MFPSSASIRHNKKDQTGDLNELLRNYKQWKKDQKMKEKVLGKWNVQWMTFLNKVKKIPQITESLIYMAFTQGW